jgi:hypothetical protein
MLDCEWQRADAVPAVDTIPPQIFREAAFTPHPALVSWRLGSVRGDGLSVVNDVRGGRYEFAAESV